MKRVNVYSSYEYYLMSEDFDKIRQAVFNRDGHKCVVCGKNENIEPHHLTYRNIYHEEFRDLITLCASCHSIFHAVDNRRKSVEEFYIKSKANETISYYDNLIEQAQESKSQRDKIVQKAIDEIKAEYLPKDYCKNGDLDMCSWNVLNPIIRKIAEKYEINEYDLPKNEIHAWFQYRRFEFFKRCLDKGITIEQIIKNSNFSYQYLVRNYRKKLIESKLSEEKYIKGETEK